MYDYYFFESLLHSIALQAKGLEQFVKIWPLTEKNLVAWGKAARKVTHNSLKWQYNVQYPQGEIMCFSEQKMAILMAILFFEKIENDMHQSWIWFYYHHAKYQENDQWLGFARKFCTLQHLMHFSFVHYNVLCNDFV